MPSGFAVAFMPGVSAAVGAVLAVFMEHAVIITASVRIVRIKPYFFIFIRLLARILCAERRRFIACESYFFATG